MTTPASNSAVAEWIQTLPVYKKYAKGIAALVGGLINLAWLLTVLPAQLVPTGWAFGVAVAVQFVVGVVGVIAVPNSATAKQAHDLEEYIGRHRKGD
ncbi:hypothetical protein AB0362_13140 [Rhodococcus sp. NPDC079359]|uniref:hypothetical protein n=1 Tax=Rhodococcus sp. NPDC079359 TaxID=3154961 RepID=UPI00344D64F4